MSREMKDSGVKWIGKIPKDWEIRKLKTIASIVTGNTPSKTNNNLYYSNEGVMWVKPDNLDEYTSISYTKEKLNEDGVKIARIAKAGSTLVCCIGSIGKFGIIGEDSAFNQQINAVTFFDQICNSKYGTYLIDISENQHWYYANGNVLKILNNENQGKILLPLPTLKEQKKIADFLDEKVREIDRLIHNAKKSIEEYKKYKQSVITEAVTKGLDSSIDMKHSGIEWIGKIPKHWKVLKIKYILEWKSEKGYPNETVLSLYRDYGIVPKDSRDDNHNVTSLDTSSYKLVDKGDFVINKMKAWQGSMAVSRYRGIVSPAYHVCRFKNNNVNKEYFHYLLRNKLYLPEFRRLSTGLRIGQWDLGFEDFKKLPYLLPSNKEQDEIVNYLNHKCSEIDNLISKKEKLISELESYKKSLIYEYVTGKKEVL